MKNRKTNQWNSYRVVGINWVLLFGLGCASLALSLIVLTPPEAQQLEQPIVTNVVAVDGTNWNLAVQYIKNSESFQSVRYELDGHWYIGYGHLMKTGAACNAITEQEATQILENDLLSMVKYAANRYNLTGDRALAIGMLFYNVRHASIYGSKLEKELYKGPRFWDELIITKSWLSMCKFQGKEHILLKQRRQFELNLFLGDE